MICFFCFQGDFTSDDFVSMSAPLLYKMFKAKTAFPLHTAIRNKREDIVFLYLMEFDAEVSILGHDTSLMTKYLDLNIQHDLSQRPVYPSFGRVIPFVDG